LMMNPVPWLQMTNMISYQGLVRTFLSNDKEFPLEPNILHNQERWRAIIPKGTDTNLIKVVDFEVERGELNFMSKFKCLWFKCKLKKKPIYLDL
ncbi:hypothetical protein ACK35F_12370, partial [Aeromonas veronii]